MLPIRVGGVADWAPVILTPTKMGNLRGIDGAAQECVPKETVGCISAWCAGSYTGCQIAAAGEALEEAAASGSALPQDTLD